MSNNKTIVLVDDEVEITKSLLRVLGKLDVNIVDFNDPVVALNYVKNNEVDIVISDQRMPEMCGHELLKNIKQLKPNVMKIILSAYQDFDDIAEGFNQGILDRYIAKPWNNKELISIIESYISPLSSNSENSSFGSMIGNSNGMLKLFESIRCAAGANVPIFVHGETGTGKELVAKACHEYSYRKKNNFIALNCANLSENLIESQLFGHKKGAFTGADKDHIGLFQQADGGTLFLDEITTLPLNLQAKLLRAIQEREFNPLGSSKTIQFDSQIISASSTSLLSAVKEGSFRQDLLYRLGVIQLHLPRLSDRGKDIISIANYYLQKFSNEHQKSFSSFSTTALKYLTEYSWPGNVRQLENLIHGVVIMNSANEVSKDMIIEHIGADILTSHLIASDKADDTTEVDNISLADIEKKAIMSAIDKSNGNVSEAAKLLDINASTIYRKMQKW